MNTVADLIRKNRSYRRFYEEIPVTENDLLEMIDAARLTPSARNAQSLCYLLSFNPDMNQKIFPALKWAGYLTGWDGPEEGERPSAYVIILNDTEISRNYFCDHGIVSLAILLSAVEKGFGGCIIGSVNGPYLHTSLNIAAKYSIVQVIALGKPKETVIIEPMPENNDIRYWRDNNGIHHVPKRSLNDLIIKL